MGMKIILDKRPVDFSPKKIPGYAGCRLYRKIKFSIRDSFSNCEEICCFQKICLYLKENLEAVDNYRMGRLIIL